MSASKFMLSLRPTVYQELHHLADVRDITIQELIRAVVIPDWLRANAEKPIISPILDSENLRSRIDLPRVPSSNDRDTISPLSANTRESIYKRQSIGWKNRPILRPVEHHPRVQ